jgi:hypothetical protein
MNSSLLRLRVRGRHAAVLATAAVVAIVAAGCASFTSPPTGAQLAPNGAVEVTSNICLFSFIHPSEGTTPANCDNTAEREIVDADETGQLLIAYEIPDGSTPGTVTSPELPGVTFSQNSNYVDWINENPSFTPAGYEWVGYMSSPFTVSGGLNLQLTAEMTPPASSPGHPDASPYAVNQVLLGDRFDSDTSSDGFPNYSLDPNRALNCDEELDTSSDPDTASPASIRAATAASDESEEPTTDCDEDITDSPTDITTRSLTTTAPSSAITVQAGNTATIPFTVEYNGPSADPFMLSGSTNSNALVATPVNPSFTPSGTGNTTENLSVPVPAGLTPGNYTVTLNVGSFGSTAATLKVTAPSTTTTTTTTTTTGPVTPQQAPTISGLSVNAASLKLSLRLNIAATERLTLARKQGNHWDTLKTLSIPGSAGSNTVRLRSLFGSLLKNSGRYRITVQAFKGTLSSAAQSLTFVES